MDIRYIQEYIKTHNKIDITYDLDLHSYSGIVRYYPEELTLTVKAGTLVGDMRAKLSEYAQDLDFSADDSQMIGSVYAVGGHHIRMSVLGVQIIDGRGEVLNFGGEVIKNVAGYDVSRLLCGSKGGCGVITQISFKVLPVSAINSQLYQTPHRSQQSNERVNALIAGIYSVFDPLQKFTPNYA